MSWRIIAAVTLCLLPGCVVDDGATAKAEGGGLILLAMAVDLCTVGSQCASSNVCLVGACVDKECRYGPNKFKPGCCQKDEDCDDKYYCNIDKCSKVMPGGWKQCVHSLPPGTPGPNTDICCTPQKCDDGNSCTWDACGPSGCDNKLVANCCNQKWPLGCDDGDPCTADKCAPTEFGGIGACEHKNLGGCCKDPKCDDGKYCTLDKCNIGTLLCTHKQNDPLCCDQAAQCDDGSPCTQGWCINHGCVQAIPGDKKCCVAPLVMCGVRPSHII